jgi:uncharacterized membrane protein
MSEKNKKKEAGKEESIKEVVLKSIFQQDKRKITFGQRTADLLTKWAGSWTFIIGFAIVLVIWISLNGYAWYAYNLPGEPFDPRPFILLNLVLSCLAAIQAPVILMSQNRQTEKDRLRAEYDYQVDRKSAREIEEIKKQLNRIERRMK